MRSNLIAPSSPNAQRATKFFVLSSDKYFKAPRLVAALNNLCTRVLSAAMVGALFLSLPMAAQADKEPKGYDPQYGFYDNKGRPLDYQPTGDNQAGDASGWHVEEEDSRVYDKDFDGDYEMREIDGRRYIRDNDYAGEQYRRDPDLWENDLDYIGGEYAYRGYSPDDYDYLHYGSDKHAILVPRKQPEPIRVRPGHDAVYDVEPHATADPRSDWMSVGVDMDADGQFEQKFRIHRPDWDQVRQRSLQRPTVR